MTRLVQKLVQIHLFWFHQAISAVPPLFSHLPLKNNVKPGFLVVVPHLVFGIVIVNVRNRDFAVLFYKITTKNILIATVSLSFLPGCTTFSNFFDNEENTESAEKAIAETVREVADSQNTDGDGLARRLYQKATFGLAGLIENASPGTEVTVGGADNSKPEFGVLTIQPIFEDEDPHQTYFWQGSVFHHDGGDRNTVNIGFGNRWVTPNEKLMLGANIFYDHEFPQDHQRYSIGIEAKSSVLDFSLNRYKAISGWVNGPSGQQEAALDGLEYQVGSQVPFIPDARVFVKRFDWSGLQNSSDLQGYEYSLDFSRSTQSGWGVEVGSRNTDDRPTDNFVHLKYRLSIGDDEPVKNNRALISNNIFESASVLDRRLEKVRRTNKIVKQSSGFSLAFR